MREAPRTTMSQSTFGVVGVKGDGQLVESSIRVGKLSLTWDSRFVLRNPELGLTGKEEVRFGQWNWSMTVDRFLELSCFEPYVVYGYNEKRKDSKGNPAPGFVNTGFYKPWLANLEEGVRVLRVKKPRVFLGDLEKRIWKQAVTEWVSRPEVRFANADDQGVTLIERVVSIKGTEITREKGDFGNILERNSLLLTEGQKLDKRTRLLTNLYGYAVEYSTAGVDIQLIGGKPIDFDGMVEISVDVQKDLAMSIGGRVNYEADWHRDRAIRSQAFSFRAVTPDGTIKGQAVVNPALKGKVIRTHPVNLKKDGVSHDGGKVVVLAEPSFPKGFARLHVQYWMTHAWAFQDQPVEDWLFTEAFEVFQDIQSGKMDLTLQNSVKAMTSYEDEEGEGESRLLAAKWAAFRWEHLGLRLNNSWGLSMFLMEGHLKFLRNFREGNLNPRIPCSVRCQIFGENAARSAGLYSGETVDDGEVRIVGYGPNGQGKLPCVVVGNGLWEEAADILGSPDLDDYVDVLFRTIDGERRCIIFRTPSGPGEYLILKHNTKDWAPRTQLYHWKSDTAVTSREEFFPVLELKNLPTRADKYEFENQLAKPAERKVKEFGIDWVLESLDRGLENVGVGALSNLIMLWADFTGGEAPQDMLGSLSDFVDASQQGGSLDQFYRIREWVTSHWIALDTVVREELVRNGRVAIDPYLWNKRSPKGVWDNSTKKYVELFRFHEADFNKSRFYRLMHYTNKVIDLFLDKKSGKAVEWIRKEFRAHPAFEVMADLEGLEKVEAMEEYLKKEVRPRMAEIEKRYSIETSDSAEEVARKKVERKKAYQAFDQQLEQELLPDGVGAFACAIYRNQGQHHRDGVLFATPSLRERFFEVLEVAVKLYREREASEKSHREELAKTAGQFNPW